jgi:hypothetical protein
MVTFSGDGYGRRMQRATPGVVRSGEDAAVPPLENPFAAPANPKSPSDLGWLTELVRTLAARKVTREQLIAHLGTDTGPSPHDSSRGRRETVT